MMKFRWVKFLCSALASMILLSQLSVTAFATETTEEVSAEEALENEKREVYELPIDTNFLTGWPEGPSVQAYSACVMDMESGAVVFSKNMNEKLYPASITKLLTVLVALENAELTDTVKISQESLDILEYGDAYIGMRPGEEITMEYALYAVLLASANEVSYAVAETVGTNNLGGDYNTFIQEMNDRARELGCKSSNWVNANGLHDENHYTTAYDMALISSELYKYEEFRSIMNVYECTIPETNLVDETRTFQQNHKMLWSGNEYYWELAEGGKTGYTEQSGTTLVTMAEDSELKLAGVVLKDYGTSAYTDTREMMEYVFENFSKVPVTSEILPEEVESLVKDDSYVLLPEGVELSSLECTVTESETAGEGTIVFTYEDQIVGQTEVLLKQTVSEQPEESVEEAVPEVRKEGLTLLEKIGIGSLVLFGIIVLVTIFRFYVNYKILEERKRLRRKQREARNRRRRRRRRR